MGVGAWVGVKMGMAFVSGPPCFPLLYGFPPSFVVAIVFGGVGVLFPVFCHCVLQ